MNKWNEPSRMSYELVNKEKKLFIEYFDQYIWYIVLRYSECKVQYKKEIGGMVQRLNPKLSLASF